MYMRRDEAEDIQGSEAEESEEGDIIETYVVRENVGQYNENDAQVWDEVDECLVVSDGLHR